MDETLNLIPRSERLKILTEQHIEKAIAVSNNYDMQCLFVYWKQYIEPTVESYCNVCMARILKNFKEMHNRMIQLEQEYRLLG